MDFFAAVNSGDVERVTDFLIPQLGWYSVTEYSPKTGIRHFVAYELAKLRRYFRGLSFPKMNASTYWMSRSTMNRAEASAMSLHILGRTADHLHLYEGVFVREGAIDCELGRIVVWSMGHDKRRASDTPSLCPDDSNLEARRAGVRT